MHCYSVSMSGRSASCVAVNCLNELSCVTCLMTPETAAVVWMVPLLYTLPAALTDDILQIYVQSMA